MPHVTADDGIRLAYQVDDFSDPWLPDDPLLLLHADVLDEGLVRDTLSVLLKRETDIQEVHGNLGQLTQAATHAATQAAAQAAQARA